MFAPYSKTSFDEVGFNHRGKYHHGTLPSILLQIQSYRALHVWTNFKKLEWRTLLSIENTRTRAEATVTKKGLSIIATINQRTYETKRPIEESYESNKSKRIIFDDEFSKWNYLVKCCS